MGWLGIRVVLESGGIQVEIVGILVGLVLSSVEILGILVELVQAVDMRGESETLLSSVSWLHFVEEKHFSEEKLLGAEMKFLVDSLVVVAEELVGILR